MPWAVRPRPIRAAAVMMAPLSARMDVSSQGGARFGSRAPFLLLAKHTQTTARDEQDARQDHEDPAAATARPRPIRTARVIIFAAAEQRAASAGAHRKVSVKGKRSTPPPSAGRRDTVMVVGFLGRL